MKFTGKWTLIALTPVIAVGLAAGSAFAAGQESHGEGSRRHGMRARFSHGGQGGGMKGMGHLGMMKEAFGMTDEQVIKIKDIHTDARKAGIKMRAGARVARIEMRQLMRAEKVDRAALDRKIKEISALREKMMRHRVDTRLKVHSLMTPEQRKKARAMTSPGRHGGGGRHGG